MTFIQQQIAWMPTILSHEGQSKTTESDLVFLDVLEELEEIGDADQCTDKLGAIPIAESQSLGSVIKADVSETPVLSANQSQRSVETTLPSPVEATNVIVMPQRVTAKNAVAKKKARSDIEGAAEVKQPEEKEILQIVSAPVIPLEFIVLPSHSTSNSGSEELNTAIDVKHLILSGVLPQTFRISPPESTLDAPLGSDSKSLAANKKDVSVDTQLNEETLGEIEKNDSLRSQINIMTKPTHRRIVHPNNDHTAESFDVTLTQPSFMLGRARNSGGGKGAAVEMTIDHTNPHETPAEDPLAMIESVEYGPVRDHGSEALEAPDREALKIDTFSVKQPVDLEELNNHEILPQESLEPLQQMTSEHGDIQLSVDEGKAAQPVVDIVPLPPHVSSLDTEPQMKANHSVQQVYEAIADVKDTIAPSETKMLTVRLNPEELGVIEIELQAASEGQLSATLNIHKKETLELLQRDVQQLNEVLKETGLEASKITLQLSMGNQTQHNGGHNHRQEYVLWEEREIMLTRSLSSASEASTDKPMIYSPRQSIRRLDIKA